MEIDWTKFPKLAPIFANRPRDDAHWKELRALMRELDEWCECGARLQFMAGAPRRGGTDGMLCPFCDVELYVELGGRFKFG